MTSVVQQSYPIMDHYSPRYPALQYNPGMEPTVKAMCGNTLFYIPMRTVSLCEKLLVDLNWRIGGSAPIDHIPVDPLSYDMDPMAVQEFYAELDAMCSHALYNTEDTVADTDVYSERVWNKIAYAVQCGARLYLGKALSWITSDSILADPIKLCHILKTLLVVDGFDKTRLTLHWQAVNKGSCSAMISSAIRHVCEYICARSIFPALAAKISACSREYLRSDVRVLIGQHMNQYDLEILKTVLPGELLLYIIGIQTNANGELEDIPLPFESLTATSAFIIAGYLEMAGVLPPSYHQYSSSRSIRLSTAHPRHYVVTNMIPRGVNFNTAPFVVGILDSGEKVIIFTSPTDNQAKIALESPNQRRLVASCGVTVKLTLAIEADGIRDESSLAVSWDRDRNMIESKVDTNIDRFLLSTVHDRWYRLDVTEVPALRSERRLTR